MTPTLLGRWQMRLVLLPTVGLLASLPVMLGGFAPKSWGYLFMLLFMGIVGLVGDMTAHQIQKLRWDGDWPGIMQLGGAAIEGIILTLLLYFNVLPGINTKFLPIYWLLLQFVIASLAMFLATHSLWRILFPHSRYRGGQWL
jgi:hypothetical protein